jgi:VWFA-related protein
MFLRTLKRAFAVLQIFTLLASVCMAQTVASTTFDDIQIELPEGGNLRIENLYGEVVVEVWKEKYVSLSATIEGTRPARSPVVIENTKQLGIRIFRRPGEPVAAIKLAIKIPETAHVEIVTGTGQIVMHGMPAAAAIRSVAGNVSIEFIDSVDADINARSRKGSVRSELSQLMSENGRVLQGRLGSGAHSLKISTEAGEITLSLTSSSVLAETTRPKPTNLWNDQNPTKAVGRPAPMLDAQEISEGDIIRVDSQLVTLNMSVVDRTTNRGLAGLTKSDFRLFENGTEQEILQFESSAAPFDILLLIDLSGSTRDVVKLIRAAALRFVDAARPSDRIGVITFAGEPTIVSPLTLNRQVLREHINAMDTLAGDTKLYDATDFAISGLLQDVKNSRRTAIILMSDGLDGSIPGVQGDGSKLPYKALQSRIQEFDGVVYTLWLNTEYESLSPLDTQPEAFDAGYDRTKEMADDGGGVFYEVESLDDLAGAYERVVQDLGTVYSFAYRPSKKNRDGKWRAIRVNVNRPSAVARGKRGYYAN